MVCGEVESFLAVDFVRLSFPAPQFQPSTLFPLAFHAFQDAEYRIEGANASCPLADPSPKCHEAGSET